ncbi:MAG: COG4648 family protein [Acidiferrobacter sp.]
METETFRCRLGEDSVGVRMRMIWLKRARTLALALLAMAYPFVSYMANVSGHPGVLGVVFAFVPALVLLLELVVTAARSRLLGWLVTGLAAIVLWRYSGVFFAHYAWAYFAEDAGTLTLLCALFARTLRPARTPLISRLSELTHGSLSPLRARYTRRVTELWALLFGVLAIVSLTLFVAASQASWAFYANVLTGPIIAGVFIGEYIVRQWLIPREERSGFIEVMRASRLHWRAIIAGDTDPILPTPRARL